jgi:5'-3' exonuclease
MKIYIVDGTYELFRAHFSQPERIAPDGMQVSAIRGFVISILNLIKQQNVTHIAIAFDSVVGSFRNSLYSGYKDGSNTPQELLYQFGLAEVISDYLGVKIWPMIDFEADDVMGTAARKFSKDSRVDQIVICSADKDMAQVVDEDKIVCFDRRKSLIINQSEVIKRYGIYPTSIPDYLGLMGDVSDSIPGIPKWGSKSASTLLYRYETIENIPQNVNLWDVKVRGARGLSSSLETNRNEAYLYKNLATLRYDVSIVEDVDALEWLGADPILFPKLCNQLGLDRLANFPVKWN